MKQLTNKGKTIFLLALIIIIAGIIVMLIKGFKFDLNYEATKQVEIFIGKEFNISDIKSITNEIFEKETVLIQKVEVYGDMVSIKVLDITDHQKTSLVEKINEKYETELKTEDVEVKTIPHTRARDILKPYIVPFMVAAVIVLIYMAIRFFRLGALNVILRTVCIAIIAELVLFSLIAITRVPLGQITIPMMLFVYVVSILGTTIKFEEKLKMNKLETIE